MFFKNKKHSSWITIFLIVSLNFLHHACGNSEDFDNSSFLNETKSALNKMNKTFITVGDSGTILTSSDGASWTSKTSET